MKYHMCIDALGVLQTWKKRQLKGMFRHEDGRLYTPDEARLTLLQYVAQGKPFIGPKDCDNFDHTKGCMGHPDEPTAIPVSDSPTSGPQVAREPCRPKAKNVCE